MPTYRVHYYMLKRLYIPVGTGLTGGETTVSPFSPAGDPIRAIILGHFEEKLQEFMQASADRRSGSSWAVQINRIPDSSTAGTPDFSAVSPAVRAREPIIYFVLVPTASAPASSTNPRDRRVALAMLDAIDNNFVEIPASSVSQGRQAVNTAATSPGREDGFAMHSDLYYACVSEVFSNPVIAYQAVNWQRNFGHHLARVAFHEIAHCKAECANRPSPSGHPWHAAIAGDIHSTAGLCSSPPQTSQSEADQVLMSRHMLCPMPFYKLDQPIDGQFYDQGQSVSLTRRTTTPAPAGGTDLEEPLFDDDDPMGDLF